MRFALFALVAAALTASVSALSFTPLTHKIHEAPEGFTTLAGGNAPSQQYLGWFNGNAAAASQSAASITIQTYAGTVASRNATSGKLTASYGSWSEAALGADANYPVSFDVAPTTASNTTTGFPIDYNNNQAQTNPAVYHYTFGVTGIDGATPFVVSQSVNDANFKSYVNSTSSLFAFINLVDSTSGYVYLGIRNNASDPNPVYVPVANAFQSGGFSWVNTAGGGSSSAGQIAAFADSAGTKTLAGWTNAGVQQNAFFAFVIYGSTATAYATNFPVSVGVFKSSTLSGSPASTLSVSVALMAILAILGFATPALF